MLDTAWASSGKKQPVMWYQELWPELKEYVLQCLETPSNFMVHTELGPFEVQVHLVLEKHVSHLRTRNGRVRARFLNFLGLNCWYRTLSPWIRHIRITFPWKYNWFRIYREKSIHIGIWINWIHVIFKRYTPNSELLARWKYSWVKKPTDSTEPFFAYL